MVGINAAMVKSLRDRTGAGMMDCKNALSEAAGDEDKAVEIIQKKGLAKAAKKAGAIAAEGMIHAYVHPGSRLGVLVEINCQTDFVARNEDFKAFVETTGLQIASMSPLYVCREDVTEAELAKKRAFFVEQIVEQIAEEDRQTGKTRPEAAVGKIVEGKLAKWLTEVCLVDQACVRDDEGKSMGRIMEELTAKIGEKISVRRFVRFELGEGIEKRKGDLAAEVAAAIQAS